jgi:nuclear protein localization family protein 4
MSTAPDADPLSITISNQPRGNEVNITRLKSRTLQNLGLKYVSREFTLFTNSSTISSAMGT